MIRRLSIRVRLIALTVGVAIGSAAVLTFHFGTRAHDHLLAQLEKTLDTKCDEVITLLEAGDAQPTLDHFLAIETNYRHSLFTYFYQVGDGRDLVLARSANLGGTFLPVPAWSDGGRGSTVVVETVADPTATVTPRFIRLRSERVTLARSGPGPHSLVIQVGASLGPFTAAMHEYRREAVGYGVAGLAAVVALACFVTTRCLRPVAALAQTASEISASNLRERLPLGGSGDEIDQLAMVLNGMLARLEQAWCQTQHFTSDAAHQLRTPLTRIRGELDLLLRNGVAPGTRQQLERIREELDRMSRACGRLLFLARLDARTDIGAALREPVEMTRLVYDLLEQIAPLAQEKGVRLVCGGVPPAVVEGSRELIVEAVLNLLHNAVRFTPAGGEVAVSVAMTADLVTIAVEDSGSGIPPEEQDRIFQRFYRGNPARIRETDEGTGLGLAIVKGIAEAHGGTVAVSSAVGLGSRFSMTLRAAG